MTKWVEPNREHKGKNSIVPAIQASGLDLGPIKIKHKFQISPSPCTNKVSTTPELMDEDLENDVNERPGAKTTMGPLERQNVGKRSV